MALAHQREDIEVGGVNSTGVAGLISAQAPTCDQTSDSLPGGSERLVQLGQLERLVAWLMVGWVPVIGLATGQLTTHLVEVLPLLPLALARRTAWLRAAAATAGLTWIYMLVALTPEFRDALAGFQVFSLQSWLAPVMVGLCSLSLTLQLTLLSNNAPRFWRFAAICPPLILACYVLNHYCMQQLLMPLEQVIAGNYAWAIALIAPSPLIAATLLLIIRRLTGCKELRLTRSAALLLVAYWLFFSMAMTASQLPGVKHY